MAIAGKKAKLVSYSSPIVFSGELTNTTDDMVYQIINSSKRIWCRDCSIIVLDGGIPTTEDYIINRLEGAVIFDSVAIRDITVTGEYLAKNDVLEAYEYSYTLEASNEDCTTFESEFVKRKQTLKDISATIERFYESSLYFLNNLLSDTDLVINFYSDASSNPDVKAWVKIANVEDSASVDGLVEESLELEGNTDLEKRCVSVGL